MFQSTHSHGSTTCQSVGLSTLLKISQPTLDQALQTFLFVGVGGKSDETAGWYRKKLTALVGALGPEIPIVSVMEADLLDWYAGLERRTSKWGSGSSHPPIEGKLSAETLHGYVRACRFFFKWLFERKVISENPAEHLPLPKVPRRGKSGISEANLLAILEAARSNVRDFAVLRFLEATGCRRGGVASLLLSDLNLDAADKRIRRRATVREKGDKERTVVMTEAALKAIQAWLEIRVCIADDHVFLGQVNGGDWKPLQEAGISEMVDRYKLRLGLKGKCSPHEWRHRWARKMLLDGMELSQVSQLLGHEDVSVTVRFYGQFTLDQLQAAYDRFTNTPEID